MRKPPGKTPNELTGIVKSDHDTLAYRLAQILIRLNRGDKVEPAALAEEFGVSVRTIQRDLNVRMAELPLEVGGGRYGLDSTFLGRLSTHDIEHFASISGISGLFPTLSREFLGEILERRRSASLIVKGHHYENIAPLREQFRAIQRAIGLKRNISFMYLTQVQSKAYQSISPLRLINNKGIWYLAALDGAKLKTFAFTKISRVLMLGSAFDPPENIDQLLKSEDGIWLSAERIKVTLLVSSQVAGYFRRRRLIANQIIEQELEDGGLLVSAVVGHVHQILPIVRYWIPHLRIVDPPDLHDVLMTELLAYAKASRAKKTLSHHRKK